MPIIESKDAAQYTDHGSPSEHCAICDHWTATGTGDTGRCRIVAGRILAEGWCRHFVHVSEAA